MKRFDNTSDLTGHSEECFVKRNLDGTECILCLCKEEPKKAKKEVKKEKAKEEFNFDFDFDEK